MEFIDHNQNIIEVSNLNFSYGKNKVLKNINLNIHKGDYIGLVGPNGGGKTTLVKLILGLLKPDSGEVKISAKPIGYVPQKVTNFDPKFPITVGEIVSMGRGKNNVDWALDQVEMKDLEKRLIGDLSGGQQQRVFIARALAQKPEIIFLDEPTSGVDMASQEEFYKLLKKLNKELGITIVIISHDIDVIINEVTEVANINQCLTYFDNPKEFLKIVHKHT